MILSEDKKREEKDLMNDKVKRILQLICGAAMVVLGILVLCYDEMFILFCAMALVIYGIGAFLSWTVHRKSGTASRGSFWIAVAAFAAGVAIFVGGTFLQVTASASSLYNCRPNIKMPECCCNFWRPKIILS